MGQTISSATRSNSGTSRQQSDANHVAVADQRGQATSADDDNSSSAVVGRTALKISKMETLRFDFRDFANLHQRRDEGVFSPPLSAHGYTWRLAMYPQGADESKISPVHVAIYLELLEGKEKEEDGKATDEKHDRPNSVTLTYAIRHPDVGSIRTQAKYRTVSKNEEWGFHNFIERSAVLDPSRGILSTDGTLSFMVDIQVIEEIIKSKPIWTPMKENPARDYLKLLEDMPDNDSDVSFLVGDNEERIEAHRCILSVRAPSLYELVKGAGTSAAVALPDVTPKVFRALLRFVYGGELPQMSFLKIHCRDLLEAADRFGCELFKLHMESHIVNSEINAENAAEWVLFADSHACALLKEKAIEFFIFDQKTVMESPSWKNVKESADLLSELLNAQVAGHHFVVGGRNKKRSRSGARLDDEDDEIESMSVATLRTRLDEEGLDVFGTREMLVKRLKRE